MNCNEQTEKDVRPANLTRSKAYIIVVVVLLVNITIKLAKIIYPIVKIVVEALTRRLTVLRSVPPVLPVTGKPLLVKAPVQLVRLANIKVLRARLYVLIAILAKKIF